MCAKASVSACERASERASERQVLGERSSRLVGVGLGRVRCTSRPSVSCSPRSTPLLPPPRPLPPPPRPPASSRPSLRLPAVNDSTSPFQVARSANDAHATGRNSRSGSSLACAYYTLPLSSKAAAILRYQSSRPA